MSADDEVAAVVRKWISDWNSGDVEAAARLDAGAVGFGFRGATCRDHISIGEEGHLHSYEKFLGSMERAQTRIDELHTSAVGEVGLAWGVHTEDYKPKNELPEMARVRFTLTLRKFDGNWRILLYHRDIQRFDHDGKYLRDHTTVSQD